MIITETENGITIDGEFMTIGYVKPNDNAVKMVGENAKKITITHFKFFTDSEEYFGKEVKINHKIYKYIGIDKTTGLSVFWDDESKCIMSGTKQL